MPDYEINKEIVFSTAHITKEENDILDTALDDIRIPITVHPLEYGYKIWVNQDPANFDGLPNVKALIDIAKVKYCKWLVLDYDGLKYPHLPTFDW